MKLWTRFLLAPCALLILVAAASAGAADAPDSVPGIPGLAGASPEDRMWASFKVTEGTLEYDQAKELWTFSYGSHQAIFDTSVRARLGSAHYRGLHDLECVGALTAAKKQMYFRDTPDLKAWEREMTAAGDRVTAGIYRGVTGECIALKAGAKTHLYRVEMATGAGWDTSVWQNVEAPEGGQLRQLEPGESIHPIEALEVMPGTLEFANAEKRVLLFRTAQKPGGIFYAPADQPRVGTPASGLTERGLILKALRPTVRPVTYDYVTGAGGVVVPQAREEALYLARHEHPEEPVEAYQYAGDLRSQVTVPVMGQVSVYRVLLKSEGGSYILWQASEPGPVPAPAAPDGAAPAK